MFRDFLKAVPGREPPFFVDKDPNWRDSSGKGDCLSEGIVPLG